VIEPSTLVIWISEESILYHVKFYAHNELPLYLSTADRSPKTATRNLVSRK